MAAHKTNSLLKCVVLLVVAISLVLFLSRGNNHTSIQPSLKTNNKFSASQDSAAESLDTLTAQLSETEKNIKSVVATNALLKQQNDALRGQVESKNTQSTNELSQQMAQLKAQLNQLKHPSTTTNEKDNNSAQPITTVPELSDTLADPKEKSVRAAQTEKQAQKAQEDALKQAAEKEKPVPYYTIPANATAVEDRLMTPLVGRIPVKGVVTDPYPFKIVFSDNTLAANGLRVPNLKQMIVSGYTEGDLNLISARGWITSLTFVFADGSISTTTSNDNNIGKFTKDNALGYLSDEYGNPAIRGKLITNAPTYLGVNIALGAAQGAANAYAQAQTTSNSTIVGTSTSSVTGSQSAYIAGQTVSGASSQVQQWWHDREENSFDAVFVPTVKDTHEPQMIVVNFAKEIHIDYDPEGRKITYAHNNIDIQRNLD